MDQFSWWCKHFHLVYLFISVLLHGSFAQSLDWSGLEEPTEEPLEYILSTNSGSAEHIFLDVDVHSKDNATTTRSSYDNNHFSKMNESDFSERQDQHQARSFPHSSGDMWKSAGRLLHRGLRMFRESILEGAKVAHMFKEDVDEGVQNMMLRQNRGIKKTEQGTPGQDKYDPGPGPLFDSQMLREGVIGGILRFMGVNSKQMGVIALNVLIILAEWITSSMIGNNEVAGVTSRMLKSNLLQWANTGHNIQIERLLTQAKSHALPEKLIHKLSEKTGNSTACVQLLICKMTPVIWGFQDTVSDQMKAYGLKEETPWRTTPPPSSTTSNASDRSFPENESSDESRGFLAGAQYLLDKVLVSLPPRERIIDFGDRCEAKFPKCQLLKFGLK